MLLTVDRAQKLLGVTSESFDQLGHYTLVIDETLDVIRQLDDVGLYTEYMLLGRGGFSSDSKHYQLDDQDWFDVHPSSAAAGVG